MANNVFANGMEISCKAASGKAIACMPDVCMTPPENPATPPGVPIPYPNTAMASDTTEGSKSVKISNKEIVLKDKSYFKKSSGDEAGSAAKKGVVTSTNRGKVYFTSWSMDVKVEGKNVARHLDMTTHNHSSLPGNTPPWPYVDSMSIDADGVTDDPCADEKAREEEACGGKSDPCADADCQRASKCKLVEYGGGGSPNCCDGQTGHHMIEDHWVQGAANFASAQNNAGKNAAPTVCLEGTRYTLDHGNMHMLQGLAEESYLPGGSNAGQAWNYGAGKSATLTAHESTFPDSDCSRACLSAQLDSFYGDDEERPLNPPHKQALAKNDPGDGRWLRSQAEQSLGNNAFGRG